MVGIPHKENQSICLFETTLQSYFLRVSAWIISITEYSRISFLFICDLHPTVSRAYIPDTCEAQAYLHTILLAAKFPYSFKSD